MLTWRHNISIHTIAHHSGGKDEVQLRTISHLPLWCQSRQFVPVRSSGSMALWAGTQHATQTRQARQHGMASGGRGCECCAPPQSVQE